MALSETTVRIIRKLFHEAQVEAVSLRLENECGSQNAQGQERIHFALLKLSAGRLDLLESAIQESKIDWRDTLMAAGFGYDVEEHRRWAEVLLAVAAE